MFEAKDIIGDAVRRAVKLFAARKRGDVVAWAEIEATAGFGKDSPHWVAFNKRFRRDFLNASGIAVWPVSGTGLQLCTHEFQLKHLPLARQRRACRQFTKSLNAVLSLPDKELTDHQRVMKSHKIEQLRAARRKVLHSVRLGHLFLRPSNTGIPSGRVPSAV
jgi:hypothetical protein